ncbi:oligosaccharide repeat unit polymerase, partial [Peptostreptococcaceae bacterium OttesenSCG-928-C18]|nr:oligosaccharide repeat unit polymerase [Peptostreptococcaceae bacterium OttesenSCG-928-C18]
MTLKESYIIFFAIFTIIVSFKLFKKASGSLSIYKLGPISMSFYALMFLSYIGTVLIVLNKADHSMYRYLRHQDLKIDVFFILSALMIVFPLVIVLLNKLFKYNPEKYQEYREKEVMLEYNNNVEFITVIIASIICILSVIFVFYKIGIKDNPYLNLIKGTSEMELSVLRIKIGNEFTGIAGYIKNIFAVALTPFISYIAYIYARKTKEKKWIILFIILFIFSNIIVFYNLQKAPIVIYWGNFIILSILYGDKLKFKYVAIIGVAGFIALNLMYIFIAGKRLDQILTLDNPIFNRTFITTPIGMFLHMEVFTYRMLPLAGASMPSFIGKTIFGFNEVVRSSSVVMKAVNFEGVRNGIAGVYNGLFLGEAYANFGVTGIIISMIHVPIVFFAFNYIFTKIKKTPIYLALFSYLTVNLVWTLHGGYTDYVFNTMWVIAIVVAVAMSLFNKGLNKILTKKENKKDENI